MNASAAPLELLPLESPTGRGIRIPYLMKSRSAFFFFNLGQLLPWLHNLKTVLLCVLMHAKINKNEFRKLDKHAKIKDRN